MRRALASLLLLAASGSARAADDCITLISQNALHFGQDDPGTKSQKEAGLNALINKYKWKANGDRVLVMGMQEVMQGAGDYNPWSGSSAPSFLTSTLWSVNSYAEAYGFVLDKNFSKQGAFVDFPWDLDDVGGSALLPYFVRPPAGVLLSCGDGTDPDENVWILNIHVTWGKSAGARNDETAAAADAVEKYLQCAVDPSAPGNCTMSGVPGVWTANRAIILGDWNRNENQVNTHLCGNVSSGYHCEVFIDDDTSINRSTQTYASNYDHFVTVYKTTSKDPTPTAGTRLQPSDYSLTSLADFVTQVSDHMGVKIGVDR